MESVPGTSSAAAESSDYSWALRSHPGRVRDGNEDFAGAFAPAEPDERGSLFVVADGMGGHAAGEVASKLAVETVLRDWTSRASNRPHQALRAAVRNANAAVFAASLDIETRGMGTTVVALAIVGAEAIVAHVGDSRAYMIRHSQTSQLTADHSRVGEMLRLRLITPEQAAHHPARSQLTRSLGGEPGVQVDVSRTAISAGDSFVLCSDGVWDLVSMRDIAEAAGAATAEETAETIVAAALERGAPDNVTAIVIQMDPDFVAPVREASGARPSFLRRVRDRLSGAPAPGIEVLEEPEA
jgi:serine/threonine protein phosphatase PrpC